MNKIDLIFLNLTKIIGIFTFVFLFFVLNTNSTYALTPDCTPEKIFDGADNRVLCGGIQVTNHPTEPFQFYVDWYYKSEPGLQYDYIDKPEFKKSSDKDDVNISTGDLMSCSPVPGTASFREPGNVDISTTDLNYNGRPTPVMFRYLCTYNPGNIGPEDRGIALNFRTCTVMTCKIKNLAFVPYTFDFAADGELLISRHSMDDQGNISLTVYRENTIRQMVLWLKIVQGDDPNGTDVGSGILCESQDPNDSSQVIDWNKDGFRADYGWGGGAYPEVSCKTGGIRPFGKYSIVLKSAPIPWTGQLPTSPIRIEDHITFDLLEMVFDPPQQYSALPNSVPNLNKKVDIKLKMLQGIGQEYKLRVVDKNGSNIDECDVNEPSTSGPFTQTCFFGKVPGGPVGSEMLYEIEIWNLTTGQKVTTVSSQKSKLVVTELTPGEVTSLGSCTCQRRSTTPPCSNVSELLPVSDVRMVTNYCFRGTTPKAYCKPLYDCNCKCEGTAAFPPPTSFDPSWGTVGPLRFDTSDLMDFIGVIHSVLIAIGVVSSVFIIPYGGILISTGTPENIKKGWDVIKACSIGLAVLILSGTIIRIIGSELIGL